MTDARQPTDPVDPADRDDPTTAADAPAGVPADDPADDIPADTAAADAPADAPADTAADRRRRDSRRILVVGTGIALVAALAAGIAVAVISSGDDGRTSAPPTGQAQLTPAEGPELGGDGTVAFTTFAGEVRSTAEYLGTPVVVNFFASWCPPCIAEMPDFEAVHQELGDEVAFLGLAMRDSVEEAEALVERTGVTYDVARDPDGSALAFYGGLGMPTTVFLDAEGTVVEVHSGQLSAEQLERIIRERLL